MNHNSRTVQIAKAFHAVLSRNKYEPSLMVFVGMGTLDEVTFFQRVWPNCRMHGFDAHPTSASEGNRVIPTDHVAIVADPDLSEVSFYVHSRPKKSSVWKGVRQQKGTTVASITLNTFWMKQRNHFDKVCLWMDCEGSELNALKGGADLMLPKVQWINLEVVWECFSGPGWPLENEVRGWLNTNGYELIDAVGNKGRCQNQFYKRVNHGLV